MKFALNATHDTLSHSNCSCGRNMSLAFCVVRDRASCIDSKLEARNLQRYNQQHDAVLQEILKVVQPKFSPTTQLTADLSDEYEFPMKLNS